MKKRIITIALLCLLLPCAFLLSACGGDNFVTFTELAKDQTLNIGLDTKFKNVQDVSVDKYYIEYRKSVNVNLYRTSYQQSGGDYIEYNGYYYYWTTDSVVTDYLELGDATTKTTVTYSYLVFGKDKTDITVKTTMKQEVSYSFAAGEYQTNCSISYDLNNYFSSIDDLKTKTPALADKIPANEINKHYVKTPRTTYSYNSQTFKDTYFYFT